MTLEHLLYSIGKVAIRNKVINYAAAGSSIYELNADTITDYPILFASPTGNHEVRTNTTDYEITLYYLDRLLRDSSNDVQIYSTAVEQLKFMMRVIEEINGVVEVADTYTISNFTETESMNDRVAGAYATVTITVMNISECDDLKEIEDSIFKLQDKYLRITENGTYSVTYDSQYEGLDKVEVLVEVPDLNGSYDEGYADGTAAGYEDGYDKGHDEGFIEGKDEGLTEGYGSGYEVGYETGNAEGTAAGYADGKEDGYNEGYQVGQNEGVEDYVETLPTLNITENGTYDEINKGVTVNVPFKLKMKDNTEVKLGYSYFVTVPDWIDLNGITNAEHMFDNCYSLKTVPLFDTSNVTSMSYMFENCNQLTTIPAFDTQNVTNMSFMFENCKKLTAIPKLNTQNVTNMKYMFNYCNNLEFTQNPFTDTSKVTDMRFLFRDCYKLTDFSVIEDMDVSSVTMMDDIFDGCQGLTFIDMAKWDTSNVKSMTNAFNCRELVTMTAIKADKLEVASYSSLWGYSNLTKFVNFGGFLNLKTSIAGSYGLSYLPNLTYQSCINVLNGLYDFVGNGETPTSSQGKLKVHANFLTTVGNDISIGTNKGWTITA